MRPYVIVPNATLPLLDGDTLRLAVDVREIDDASITFPPVGMKAKRQQHGLMLRCPLAGGTWTAERTPSGWKLRGGARWVT